MGAEFVRREIGDESHVRPDPQSAQRRGGVVAAPTALTSTRPGDTASMIRRVLLAAAPGLGRVQRRSGALTAVAAATQPPRIQARAAGGDVVIRRWLTRDLEPTKKDELLARMTGSSEPAKRMVLTNLAARTKDVAELESLLAKTDSSTLNSILSGLDPSPAGDRSSFVFGGWAGAALQKVSGAELLQLVQTAQDDKRMAEKAKKLYGLVQKLNGVEALRLVGYTKTASVAVDLVGLLAKKAELPALFEFLDTASVDSVRKALQSRAKGEELSTVRPKVVAAGASDNSVVAENRTVIEYYRIDDLPISADDKTYARNALEVFDGNPAATNTWRGQRDAYHGNNNGDLPGVRRAGGYLEHDVESPTEGGAGTRRLVTDQNSNAVYYTNTHYGSTGSPAFYLIRKA